MDAPDRISEPAFASLRYRPWPEYSWPIARGPVAAAVTHSLHLIRNKDGTNEIHRVDANDGRDPVQVRVSRPGPAVSGTH